MNDKTITTFETTLTWFFLTDKLPEDGSEVLISFNCNTVTDSEFYTHSAGDYYPHFLSHEVTYTPSKIKMWCYLPEFD